MRSNPVMPPTYLLIAILVMLGLHVLWPGSMIIQGPWRFVGLLPILCGIALNVGADRAFHKSMTTVRPFEQSSRLVTQGLYRLSRNPMYLGFLLILVGLGALLGTLTPFAAVIIFAILIQRNFIFVEEGMLARQFGDEWRNYVANTRRWL